MMLQTQNLARQPALWAIVALCLFSCGRREGEQARAQKSPVANGSAGEASGSKGSQPGDSPRVVGVREVDTGPAVSGGGEKVAPVGNGGTPAAVVDTGKTPGTPSDSLTPKPKPAIDQPIFPSDIKSFGEWRERFDAAATPGERLEFFAQSSSNVPSYFPRMIRTGLADDAEPIRIEAIESSRLLGDDERVPLLAEVALTNESEETRDLAMDGISMLPRGKKTEIYHQLLDAEYTDVAEVAASRLANVSTPQAFDLLLDGLDSSNAGQRAHVSSLIEEVVGESFDSRGTARRWWSENRDRYDETMSRD